MTLLWKGHGKKKKEICLEFVLARQINILSHNSTALLTKQVIVFSLMPSLLFFNSEQVAKVLSLQQIKPALLDSKEKQRKAVIQKKKNPTYSSQSTTTTFFRCLGVLTLLHNDISKTLKANLAFSVRRVSLLQKVHDD